MRSSSSPGEEERTGVAPHLSYIVTEPEGGRWGV